MTSDADLAVLKELFRDLPATGLPVQGVGVDLVHVPSFAEQLAQPGSRFAEVFTPGERRDVAARGGHARHFAARWAAREALVKAWSQLVYGEPPLLGDEALRQIEVACDAWGRPRLLLGGDVAAYLGECRADLSLSHDGDYAVAYVVLSAASR
ncbi:holo-ACP synthase AcpS [Nocardioides jiangxiensis]|uniref:Holo-[acyl-carrier-protein] synthase n=1 Tax=Nocardioides jiangxiensis TaxID=3064524 RepID=A0ABT9AZK3_9ACTN|nr:holo-ACP synthase [Nocardioides sp. WY-20]MDO7868024.1 holo-ACP synthase [Nocardioides sp. WY-20]